MNEHKHSVFGPLLLVAIGAVWLLVSMGQIPVENLWALAYLWPFLLIAAGVGLILRSFWKDSRILIDVLLIGGAVAAIFYAGQLGWNQPPLYIGGEGVDFGSGERGSRNIVTEERDIKDVKTIKVDFPVELTIHQGEKESLTVTGDDNVLAKLSTNVKDGVLKIETDDNAHFRPTRAVEVEVTVKDLSALNIDSAGKVLLDGLETESLDVVINGAGSLNFNRLTLEKMDVKLNGAGSITVSGTADDLTLSMDGTGSFDGEDLHTKNATVSLDGLGSVTVWVDTSLDINLDGAGSVSYYGSPNVTQSIDGIGSVKKAGDK